MKSASPDPVAAVEDIIANALAANVTHVPPAAVIAYFEEVADVKEINYNPLVHMDYYTQCMADMVAAEGTTLQWFNAAGGWSTTTSFDASTSFCKDKDLRMCTRGEYCQSGQVFGGTKAGDVWAPYSGDGENSWMQLGTDDEVSTCSPYHSNQRERPTWGTGEEDRSERTSIGCCAGSCHGSGCICCSNPYIEKAFHCSECRQELLSFCQALPDAPGADDCENAAFCAHGQGTHHTGHDPVCGDWMLKTCSKLAVQKLIPLFTENVGSAGTEKTLDEYFAQIAVTRQRLDMQLSDVKAAIEKNQSEANSGSLLQTASRSKVTQIQQLRKRADNIVWGCSLCKKCNAFSSGDTCPPSRCYWTGEYCGHCGSVGEEQCTTDPTTMQSCEWATDRCQVKVSNSSNTLLEKSEGQLETQSLDGSTAAKTGCLSDRSNNR